jgi:hypothetical protein
LQSGENLVPICLKQSSDFYKTSETNLSSFGVVVQNLWLKPVSEKGKKGKKRRETD